MAKRHKVGRNDPCPCVSGEKYKHCCEGKVDWENLFRSGANWNRYLSIRGRNFYFAERIAEALQFDKIGIPSEPRKAYKAAFTSNAVREIHEAAMETWPPDMDIVGALQKNDADVSGLYIGDYDLEYINRGIVRHSIYANKILVVDPFIYPRSVRDEYNPILNPDQYRSQTLKNVNFYLSLMPWIEAGLVEIIRTPADFDQQLNWDSMKRVDKKFAENEELRKAVEKGANELSERHKKNMAMEQFILNAPDAYLRKIYGELKTQLPRSDITEDQYIEYIQSLRDSDPNFLEPLEPGESSGQLLSFSTGANYEIAKLTANLTGSYLVTDLSAKWKEIEVDREDHSAENVAWAPFAKSLQEANLKYLEGLRLEHALKLRNEGRLEGLRSFLHGLWKDARNDNPYSEENAVTLANQLTDEIRKADVEWKEISTDLVKIVGFESVGALMAAGPAITAGHASFLGAATIIGAGATLAYAKMKTGQFPDKFPAAFFMDIKE